MSFKLINQSLLVLKGLTLESEIYFRSKGLVDISKFEDSLNGLFSLNMQKNLKKSCSLVYDAIESKNYEILLSLLPVGHKVRLLYDLFESALFVDVETNGLANDSYVTCISILFNNECKTFIKDVNMCDFIPYLNQSSLVVTFNGERFDIPFLLKTFGPLRLPPHIDLMAECKPYGYHGSLKKIEKLVGFEREYSEGITGLEAIDLWNKYIEFNNHNNLKTLIKYNQEDVLSLVALYKKILHNSLDGQIVPFVL